MKNQEILMQAYHRFVKLEREEWGTDEFSAIRRYSWSIWYMPSLIQFTRLVAEFVSEQHTYSGGLPRLHSKMQHALASIDKIPKPLPASEKTLASVFQPLPADLSLGQVICDVPSRIRVARILNQDFPYGAHVALLGDDDMISCAIAGEHYPTVVYDIDPRLGDLIGKLPHTEFRMHDIRNPLDRHKQSYDAVFLDPADGSVALSKWLARADECLSLEDGPRLYLSINPWRMGRRWTRVITECVRRGLIPCAHYPRLKAYPQPDGINIQTDIWVFERTNLPSDLPQPYLDIEVFR